MSQIYELLQQAKMKIGAIPKDQRVSGSGGNYPFRGIDTVLNKVGPILTELGITMLPNVTYFRTDRYEGTDRDGKSRATYATFIRVEVAFVAPDGSQVMVSSVGRGMDFTDHDSNKAMSGAIKYALVMGLQIPVDAKTLDDADAMQLPQGFTEANGTHPNDSASAITSALAAIRNSMTIGKLTACRKRAKEKVDAGEFTAQEYKRLEVEIIKREAELTPVEATK